MAPGVRWALEDRPFYLKKTNKTRPSVSVSHSSPNKEEHPAGWATEATLETFCHFLLLQQKQLFDVEQLQPFSPAVRVCLHS